LVPNKRRSRAGTGRDEEGVNMTILKCDICGRTSNDTSNINKYKLKKEVYNWYECSWEQLDICDDCVAEIRKRVLSNKE
jgi:hypothetical protein